MKTSHSFAKVVALALIVPAGLAACGNSASTTEAASKAKTSYVGKVDFPKAASQPKKPVAKLVLKSYKVKRDPGGEIGCLPILGCAATKSNTFAATAKIKNAGNASAEDGSITLIISKGGSPVATLTAESTDIDPGFTKTLNFYSNDNYESGTYAAELKYTPSDDTYEKMEAEDDAQAAREDAVQRELTKRLNEYNSVDCDFDSDMKFTAGTEVECSASLTAEESSWDAMRKVIVKFTDNKGAYTAEVVKR
ncbi:hypothetical protein [Actinoplanes sp. NPDC049681]|uniref:hypothetical protein n=1 Tax=Actinoplanes sp. NPDC049681 TaxID=3363905 RepID=UPI00378C9F66